MEDDLLLLRRRVLIALGVLPLAPLARATDLELARTGGPFVPTPQVVVDEMLRMAKVGASDFVIDLGSGDGIIVLTAAQRLKAQGFGVDIDPELVQQANNEAKKRGVADRARFHVMDVFRADISKATVVTLYLLPGMMTDLRGKIFNELKPGTRVVSHDYHFGDAWRADAYYTWDVPEKEKVNGVPRATVYLWIVPAKIAGRWQLRLTGPTPEQYELAIKQNYQSLEGRITGGGLKGVRLSQSNLQGEDISFAFPVRGDRHRFKGRISGNTMEGTVELAGEKGSAKWTASRVS